MVGRWLAPGGSSNPDTVQYSPRIGQIGYSMYPRPGRVWKESSNRCTSPQSSLKRYHRINVPKRNREPKSGQAEQARTDFLREGLQWDAAQDPSGTVHAVRVHPDSAGHERFPLCPTSIFVCSLAKSVLDLGYTPLGVPLPSHASIATVLYRDLHPTKVDRYRGPSINPRGAVLLNTTHYLYRTVEPW